MAVVPVAGRVWGTVTVLDASDCGAVVAVGLVSGAGAAERLGGASVLAAALVGGLPLRRRRMPTSTWLASCRPLMATKRLIGTP